MIKFIKVTQEDINAGVRGDPDSCPIAFAAKRVMPGVAECAVYPIVRERQGPPYDWVVCFTYLGGGSVPIMLPDVARRWAMMYDAGYTGEPFTFEVEI